jgi:predicted flap endonuclease-1-like 5' DNA nuclease
MITPANRASPRSPESRDALQQSEKKASESQPGSFNDKALTDKVVEVPPLGNNLPPIKGLDPKPSR